MKRLNRKLTLGLSALLVAGLAGVAAYGTGIAAASAATVPPPPPRPPPRRGLRLRDRQLAGARDRQRPVPDDAPAAATAATWAWRATGRGTELQDRQLPRLRLGQRGAGERQLQPVPRRRRHRRLLVHGRPWRRPALERHHHGGLPLGRAAGVVGAAAMVKSHIPYPVLWADIELPGIAPAPDNGWNSVYTSPCSGMVRQSGVPAVDRPGGVQRVRRLRHVALHVQGRRLLVRPRSGRTSSAPARLDAPQHLRVDLLAGDHEPVGRADRLVPARHGTCAQFFGGQTSSSKYALMWQWSGGGGVTNGLRRLRPDRRRADGLKSRASYPGPRPPAAGRAAATGCPAGWR